MGAPKEVGNPAAATREFPGSCAAKSAKEASREFTKLLKLKSDESRLELPIPMFPILPNEAVEGKIVPDDGKRFIKT